ncbi:MAG: hypothetical protein JWM80_3451 [Cyanobacteria bacterium RYN_339]|nr:hypothetical protein [Cyanobacteria bacterium RYN_339]
MLPINAESLIRRFAKPGSRISLDAGAKHLVPKAGLQGALKKLLEKDMVAWDAKTQQFIATASHIKIDEAVRPADQSKIFDGSIEQCMEFVMRYFRTVREKFHAKDGGFGADWTMQYNIADDVKHIADGSLKKPGYVAFRNGGAVPPRAGDVLSMQSPVVGDAKPRHFHVALISDVYQKGRRWYAKVFEANVPYHINVQDVKKHYAEIPLKVHNGKFELDRVRTSLKGYTTDMDVVGWIHPLKEKALPGAP